jgi:hypothetical protein
MRKVLFHPVTQFNLLIVVFLSIIQGLHLHAHHTMSVDVDSYVHKFLKKNPDTCRKIDY